MNDNARAAKRSTTDPAAAQLASRLHSVAIHLLRRVRRDDALSGLSAARASALSVLVFGGPRTIGELAAAEQVTAPTMTRLVAGLEAEGYLTRKAVRADRRAVQLTATARGRRALEAGRQRRVQHVLELLAELDADETAVISEAVGLLERVLQR